MTQQEAFEAIFALTGSCSSIFIAGGAAVDYDKAGDIDVWFANSNTTGADKFLTSMPFYERAEIGDRKYLGGGELIGEGYLSGIAKPIQVLVTPAKDVKELLNYFDLSCHAHAVLSRKMERVSHKEATPTWVRPNLLNKKHKKTLGRYIKLCARYGHNPDEEVLAKLSEDTALPVVKVYGKGDPSTLTASQADMATWLNDYLKIAGTGVIPPHTLVSYDFETKVEKPILQNFIYNDPDKECPF